MARRRRTWRLVESYRNIIGRYSRCRFSWWATCCHWCWYASFTFACSSGSGAPIASVPKAVVEENESRGWSSSSLAFSPFVGALYRSVSLHFPQRGTFSIYIFSSFWFLVFSLCYRKIYSTCSNERMILWIFFLSDPWKSNQFSRLNCSRVKFLLKFLLLNLCIWMSIIYKWFFLHVFSLVFLMYLFSVIFVDTFSNCKFTSNNIKESSWLFMVKDSNNIFLSRNLLKYFSNSTIFIVRPIVIIKILLLFSSHQTK